MPAWADDTEGIERKLERRGPEAAWNACGKLMADAPLEGEVREPCALADLRRRSEDGATPSIEDLDDIAQRWSGTAAGAEAHETAAERALEDAGQDAAQLDAILKRYPDTETTPLITERLLELAAGSAATLHDFWEKYPDAVQRPLAWELYLTARYEEAMAADRPEVYAAVLEEHPEHPFYSALWLAWGEARFRELEDTEAALESFLHDLSGHPREAEVAQVLDERLFHLAQTDGRAQAWSALLARRPQHPRQAEIHSQMVARQWREAVFTGPDAVVTMLQQNPEHPQADIARALVAKEQVAVSVAVPRSSDVVLSQEGVTTLPLGSMKLNIRTALSVDDVRVELVRDGNREPLSAENMPLPDGLRSKPVSVEVTTSGQRITIELSPGWCAPDGAELALSMTVLDGTLTYPFTAPFTCEDLSDLWGLSASVSVGGRSWRLGEAAQSRSGSTDTNSLGGKLIAVGVSCSAYDECYSSNSAYNRQRPTLNKAFDPIKAGRVNSDHDLRRQGALLMFDQQYVGPQTGDPSFTISITDARLMAVVLQVNPWWVNRFHPLIVEAIARGELTDAPIPYLTAIAQRPIRDAVPSWHTMLALNTRAWAVAELIHRGEFAVIDSAWSADARSHSSWVDRVLTFSEVGREDFAEIQDVLLVEAMEQSRTTPTNLIYVGRQGQQIPWFWTPEGWMLGEPQWSSHSEAPEHPVLSAAAQERLSARLPDGLSREMHQARRDLLAEPPDALAILRTDGIRVTKAPDGAVHSRWLVILEPLLAPTLEQASAACAALELGGRTGWQVPPTDVRLLFAHGVEEMKTLGSWQRDPLTGEGWLEYTAYIGNRASQGWTGLGPRKNPDGLQTRSGRAADLSIKPEHRQVRCVRPLEESEIYEAWVTDIQEAIATRWEAAVPLP